MCSVETYFFNMWNQFILIDCKLGSINIKSPQLDRASYSVWMAFVQKYGGDIKRMKMEALLAMNVTHCWEQGTLDANGVQDIFREFGKVKKGNASKPPPDFLMAHRLLKSGVEHKYAGLEDFSTTDGVGFTNSTPKTKEWFEKEAESINDVNGLLHAANGMAEKNFESFMEEMELTEKEEVEISNYVPTLHTT